MQKKKDDIPAFRLLVVMTFKAVVEPKKYAPPSPINIFALGKLNNKKISNIIIWDVIRTEIICKSLFKLINNNIELIIINCKANRPLKPSIKFEPFIINKKQKSINKVKKISKVKI